MKARDYKDHIKNKKFTANDQAPLIQRYEVKQKISEAILRLAGWRVDKQLPALDRYVLIAYPHTSNWDFVLGMLAKWSLQLPLNWVAKHSIFRGPLRPLLIAMGGVPLNRQKSSGFIEKNIELFRQRDKFILGLMPEGTRSKTRRWKTGFYHIARGADVPIALGYLDYRHKVIGVAKLIYPSGDIHRDFEQIKAFYADKQGYRPENQGDLRIDDHSDKPAQQGER